MEPGFLAKAYSRDNKAPLLFCRKDSGPATAAPVTWEMAPQMSCPYWPAIVMFN